MLAELILDFLTQTHFLFNSWATSVNYLLRAQDVHILQKSSFYTVTDLVSISLSSQANFLRLFMFAKIWLRTLVTVVKQNNQAYDTLSLFKM